MTATPSETHEAALSDERLRKWENGIILASGETFAVLPVKCIDGRWAWFRKVGWADWNPTMFLNPEQTIRIYSLGARA
jgi:hypothetical protein